VNEEFRIKNKETRQRMISARIEIVSGTARKIIYDDFGA
jgi:hypothetical protein